MIVGGVLGSPISHSLSPLLHKTMYEFLGIEATYSAFEVDSGGLENFLQDEGAAFNNISLTMPLKEEALSVADSVSEISRQIQSGNTMFKRNGVWNLTSTDVEGFTYALQSHSRSAQGNVLIIGAGAVQSGSMSTIDWSNDNYYLKVGMDANGGTSFLTMGTTQLLSVPYALYAKSAGTFSGGGTGGGNFTHYIGEEFGGGAGLVGDDHALRDHGVFDMGAA